MIINYLKIVIWTNKEIEYENSITNWKSNHDNEILCAGIDSIKLEYESWIPMKSYRSELYQLKFSKVEWSILV